MDRPVFDPHAYWFETRDGDMSGFDSAYQGVWDSVKDYLTTTISRYLVIGHASDFFNMDELAAEVTANGDVESIPDGNGRYHVFITR